MTLFDFVLNTLSSAIGNIACAIFMAILTNKNDRHGSGDHNCEE